MTTATTTAAPERARRCRMHSRRGNPCNNPALDDDENSIDICVRHAAEVMELIKERRAAAKKKTA